MLQQVLVAEVHRHDLSTAEVTRLLGLIGDQDWPRLHVALQEITVSHARRRAEQEPTDQARSALATALLALGAWLTAVGERRRALAATEEAVTLYRDLARAEPARYTPYLAGSLHNLGVLFQRVDQVEEQLRVRAEAVAWWARLAGLRPDEHQDTYQRERVNLVKLFTQRGLDLHAATAAENTALLHLPVPPADHVPEDAEPRDLPTADENDNR